MNNTRICPDCRAEYHQQVVKCADCGTDLLLPGQLQEAGQRKPSAGEKRSGSLVVIREGDLGWMAELRSVLAEAAIPSELLSEDSCRKGCSSPIRLAVAAEDFEQAQQEIEEYFAALDPELAEARRRLEEGRCPACSCAVAADTPACPDCGLQLLIAEDE